MEKLDDLFTIEVLEDYKCSITFTTSADVGFCLDRLLKEGLFCRDIFEKMIQHEYDCFNPSCAHDDYFYDDDNQWEDLEILENDKRVIDQYDPDYFAFLEWIRYRQFQGVSGLDPDQIERLWKLHRIRKLMKKK